MQCPVLKILSFEKQVCKIFRWHELLASFSHFAGVQLYYMAPGSGFFTFTCIMK